MMVQIVDTSPASDQMNIITPLSELIHEKIFFQSPDYLLRYLFRSYGGFYLSGIQ